LVTQARTIRGEQLVRVQRQHDPPDPALEVVLEEGRRPEVAPPLEDDVIEDVVDVDEEAAGRQTGNEADAPRRRVHGGAGNGRGDEMASRAHTLLVIATRMPGASGPQVPDLRGDGIRN